VTARVTPFLPSSVEMPTRLNAGSRYGGSYLVMDRHNWVSPNVPLVNRRRKEAGDSTSRHLSRNSRVSEARLRDDLRSTRIRPNPGVGTDLWPSRRNLGTGA
jgi:hypothetical protein